MELAFDYKSRYELNGTTIPWKGRSTVGQRTSPSEGDAVTVSASGSVISLSFSLFFPYAFGGY